MTHDWTPEDGELAPEQMTLEQLLERYATLRDTVQSLETEKEDLAGRIKAALAAGERAETDLYRAELKISRRVDYPLERFREVFGDAAALEAATIDRRKAEALARAGDLDGEALRNLAVGKEIQSLRLVPKTY
ncbi:hypothetical protein [Deinococcus radiophilus]|uniref:Uncharacterized protein n=1 Tax=Deinococcus radiophilus TaxID=32062 RepID=A0A431W450_9DEIO|nr:hypothetical protein [Deinococcus radiophilus]RTR30256.1 hypothetical protein EJ104_01735 [Deinococcus radiophilus]UFA49951.1 hypothetical protein LMT64_08665 [Deinococcus radiophilus]